MNELCPLFLSDDNINLNFNVKQPCLFTGVANFAALHPLFKVSPQIAYMIDINPNQNRYFKWLIDTIVNSNTRMEFAMKVWNRILTSKDYPNISNMKPLTWEDGSLPLLMYIWRRPRKRIGEYGMYWGEGFLKDESTFDEFKTALSQSPINYIDSKMTVQALKEIFAGHKFFFRAVWLSNLFEHSFRPQNTELWEWIYKIDNSLVLRDTKNIQDTYGKAVHYGKVTFNAHYDAFRIVSKYQKLRPMIEVFCEKKNESELCDCDYMSPDEFMKNTDYTKGVFLHILMGECGLSKERFNQILEKAKKHVFVIILEFKEIEGLVPKDYYYNKRGVLYLLEKGIN